MTEVLCFLVNTVNFISNQSLVISSFSPVLPVPFVLSKKIEMLWKITLENKHTSHSV